MTGRAERGARASDYPALRDLLLSAWPNPNDELGIWDYLVASDPTLEPGNVRLVCLGGRPVAATTLVMRQVRTRQGWISGAELTLVCCHPDHRRKGYGGATVRGALAHLARRGGALAVFYGVPEFYPRFGCVPVLPGFRTELAVAPEPGLAPSGADDRSSPGLGETGLRDATEADLPGIARLHDERISIYPASVARSAAPWMWRVRNPESHALWTLPDGRGYAHVAFNREGASLDVQEAAAADGLAARRLLAGLTGEARRRGFDKVHLFLAPDNLVARLARLDGAWQRYRPAAAGFVAITRWEPHLPPGYRVVEDARCDLFYRSEPGGPERRVLRAGRGPLTELLMGYLDIDDLLLRQEGTVAAAPSETLPPGTALTAEGDLDQLRADFPKLLPKYTMAPYYFWF